MRKTLLSLHLYTALLAGIFIVILGVTGSIMAFETELDHMSGRSLFYVQPQGAQLPPSAIFKSLQAAYPKQRIAILALPAGPTWNYYTNIKGSQVFINSYTGQIAGTRNGITLLAKIHQMHLHLLIPGKVGANIEMVVSCGLVWLVLSGLYLWWPLKRATVKFNASGRRIAFDLHSTVGIYTAIFLFVLAATGIVVHWDDASEVELNQMAHVSQPPRFLPSTPAPGAKTISPDQALQIAEGALPGTTPGTIYMPGAFVPKAGYRVDLYYPEDLTQHRSWVLIDQFSGKILFVESSRTAVFGTKAIIQNRAIHTGQIYGYPSKILMSLSSLMLVSMVISGYYMWWKKLRSATRIAELRRAELAETVSARSA